jgi:hypothetical protein
MEPLHESRWGDGSTPLQVGRRPHIALTPFSPTRNIFWCTDWTMGPRDLSWSDESICHQSPDPQIIRDNASYLP